MFLLCIGKSATYPEQLFQLTTSGEIPIKKLKLEDDQVTFLIDMGWGKNSPSKMDFYILDFKGKLDGRTIRGELRIEGVTDSVTFKRVD